jgi:RNA polymerase sigma factor (sigma-70 family)
MAGDLFQPLWLFLVSKENVPEPDAEELVQNVLMKVYYRVGTFCDDGRAKLTTWIFEIAKNCAIDFHHVRREELESLTLTEKEEIALPVLRDEHFAGRNRELLEWLKGELSKLSAENQDIQLWRAQGFTYAEIGAWLGITEGAARVRHTRATKKLMAAHKRAGYPGIGGRA